MSRLGLTMAVLTGLVLGFDVYVLGLKTVASVDETLPTQTGIASWYNEQGQLTADGETYDRTKFTAAHRKLPFNTVVRVTNKTNGHMVKVRINDRGPFVKNRVLDLSEAAAKALDMKTSGTVPVIIEVVEQAPAPAVPGSTLP